MDSEVRAKPVDRFGFGVVNIVLGFGTFTWVSEIIGAFIVKIGILMILSALYTATKGLL